MSLPELNYHHLRLFWEVARAGSLRAAAQKLHLSQPTISAQIKSLEGALEQALFDRTGRSLKLTAAGKLVMERAEEIFSLGSELVHSLRSQGTVRTQRLHIGLVDSLPKLMVWKLIRPMLQAFPELQIFCSEGHSQDLLGALAIGRLDFILSDEAAQASQHVKAYSLRLGSPPIVFCAVPALAASLGRGFPASLQGAPVVLPAGRTAWRHELDRWFDAQHLAPRVVAEFDNAELMKTAAADGLGVAPVAATVLNEVSVRYGLKPLGLPVQCGFSCFLITLDRRVRHPAVATLLAEAKQLFGRDTAAIARSFLPPEKNKSAAS